MNIVAIIFLVAVIVVVYRVATDPNNNGDSRDI